MTITLFSNWSIHCLNLKVLQAPLKIKLLLQIKIKSIRFKNYLYESPNIYSHRSNKSESRKPLESQANNISKQDIISNKNVNFSQGFQEFTK
jgi:hypothetical protein